MRPAVSLIVAALAASAVTIGTSAYAQDADAAEAGGEVYAEHCATCHGERLTDPGGAPDLRELHASDKARFETTVTEGRGQMPAWGGIIASEQIAQLWAYIRAHAFDR
jgi:mono/diheme cytochrome c family protein